MNPRPDVLSYVRSQAFQEAARESASRPPAPFVTISRQRGAGGSAVAQALLERFAAEDGELFSGWRTYDRALCEEVAADPKLSVFLDALLRESYRGGMADLMAQLIAQDSPQAAVTRRLFAAIRAAALVGKAVIIGRAGNLAARHLPLGVHFRLVGSREARLQRLLGRGFSKKDAERELRAADAARAQLVRSWFRKDIEDPLLYDAVLNTDHLSPSQAAGLIFELVNTRWAALAPAEL